MSDAVTYQCTRCGLKSEYVCELTCSECVRDTRLLNFDVVPMTGPIEVSEVDLLNWKLR